MHSTRSWQDSFDRLERSRREEQRLREAEERQVREAEAAYARASLEVSRAEVPSRAEPSGFMLAARKDAQAETLVTAKAPVQSPPLEAAPAKSAPEKKPGPAKRAAPRRKARAAKSRTAKPRTVKPKAAKQATSKARTAKPAVAKIGVAKIESVKHGAAAASLCDVPSCESLPSNPTPPQPPAISLPRAAQPASAEPLLITPLPRSAALARYRKPGLFGLIGSWLRLAASRPKLPVGLRGPAPKDARPRHDLAALRAENKRLRRELEALKTLQEVQRAEAPPWIASPLAIPAGDVPARPRRRDGILR